ncbi:unnamed protein product [Amoebophrya sp. A120]|nr:unnamed protein product [Amoebophrya sp. A120]|eukprot:GSA120T00015137001.1
MAHVEYLPAGRTTEFLPDHLVHTIGRWRHSNHQKVLALLKNGPCSAEEMAYALRLTGSLGEQPECEDSGTVGIAGLLELCEAFWIQVNEHLETYPINVQSKILDSVAILTKLLLDPKCCGDELRAEESLPARTKATLEQFRSEVENWWPSLRPAHLPPNQDEGATEEDISGFATPGEGVVVHNNVVGATTSGGRSSVASFHTAMSTPPASSSSAVAAGPLEVVGGSSSSSAPPRRLCLITPTKFHAAQVKDPGQRDAEREVESRFAQSWARHDITALLTEEGMRADMEERAKLKARLIKDLILPNWKKPVELLFAQLRRAARLDNGAGNGEHDNLAGACGHLVGVIALATKHCEDPRIATELVSFLATGIDPLQKIGVLQCRLLVLLLPNCVLQETIVDGRLWRWWGILEEGKLAKFDMMWFKVLARFAKNRWRGGLACCDEEVQEKAATVLARKSTWLFNKVLRRMCLPLFSPVASTLDAATAQAKLDTSRYGETYKLPNSLEQLMGPVSTWKFVTKFLVYSLESDPGLGVVAEDPKGSTTARSSDKLAGSAAASPSTTTSSSANMLYWQTLELLLRRIFPYIQGDRGEWSWHVMTFIYLLTNAYAMRASRERTRARGAGRLLRAPSKSRELPFLSKDADTYFCFLVVPLLKKTMVQRDAYAQHASLDSLARLARLTNDDTLKVSQVSTELEISMGSATVDEVFKKYSSSFSLFHQWDVENSLHSLFCSGLEVLNDPSQATRINGIFRLFARLMPSVLRFFPSFVPQILDLILVGIDPTDSAKTLAVAALIVNLFSSVPCLDIGDLPSEQKSDATARAPAPLTCRDEAYPGEMVLRVGSSVSSSSSGRSGASADVDRAFWEKWEEERKSGAVMASSAMPGFALDLFDRSLQYILDTSLDGGKKGQALNTGQALDKVNGNLLFICNFLVLSQTSTSIQNQVLERMKEFVQGEIHKDKIKTVKGLLQAIARAMPEAALRELLPLLVKRIESGRSGHVEVFYCMSLLQGLVRLVGGTALLPYRQELERVLSFGLNYCKQSTSEKAAAVSGGTDNSKENRAVHKATAKLFRRLLAALGSSYIVNDFRVVSEKDWRNGLTQQQVQNLWAQVPWWRCFPLRKPVWYVPGVEELAWATELGSTVASNILHLVCAAYVGGSVAVSGGTTTSNARTTKDAADAPPPSADAMDVDTPTPGAQGGGFFKRCKTAAAWIEELLETPDTPCDAAKSKDTGDWEALKDDASSITFESHTETRTEFRRAFKVIHQLAESSGAPGLRLVGGCKEDFDLLESEQSQVATAGAGGKRNASRVQLLRNFSRQPFLLADRVLSLFKALLRGGHALWADELTDYKIWTAPQSFPHFFEPLAIAMRLMLEKGLMGSNAETVAVSEELDAALLHAGDPPAGQSKLATTSAASSSSAAAATTSTAASLMPLPSAVAGTGLTSPQVTKKYLRCVAELWMNQIPCNSGSLFRTKRPAGSQRGDPFLTWYMNLFGESVISQMAQTHYLAKHRDVPRLWWTQKLCVTVDSHSADRVMAGYTYQGQRRHLCELLLEISLGSPDAQIRQRAQGLLSRGARKHIGAKGSLAQNFAVRLRGVKYQMQGLLRQIDFSEEQKKAFANQLNGISFTVGGTMRSMLITLWRGRGRASAAFCYKLMDLLYHLSISHQSSKEVVKTTVLQRVFCCVDAWIEHRDRPCYTKKRKMRESVAVSPDDDDQESKGRTNLLLDSQSPWKIEDFLEIFRRPDCHWRVKTVLLVVAMVLCHHADGPENLWELILREAIPVLQPTAQQGLIRASVLAMVFGFRKHPGLVRLVPDCYPGGWDAFFAAAAEALPQLARNVAGTGQDPTRGTFDAMRSFRVTFPTSWIRHSGANFSTCNALFWQTVVAAMLKQGDALAAVVENGTKTIAAFCAAKPMQEEHYHTAVIEVTAGVLRAARKVPDSVKQMWAVLHSVLRTEILTCSKEAQSDWADCFRYIVTGTSKKLRLPAGEDGGGHAVSIVHAVPLLNFAMRGLENEAKSPPEHAVLVPIPDDECTVTNLEEEEIAAESSFLQVKKMRLRLAVIIEVLTLPQNLPPEWGPAILSIFRHARARLAHPLKNLREEAARVVSGFLRLGIGSRLNTGEAWIKIPGGVCMAITDDVRETTQRLAEKLREDLQQQQDGGANSPVKKPGVVHNANDIDKAGAPTSSSGGDTGNSPTKTGMKELQRKPHVNESMGVLHVLIHAVSAGKAFALDDCFLNFVVLCSTHHDQDLRGLGWMVLAQVASAVPPNRALLQTSEMQTSTSSSSLSTADDILEAYQAKRLQKLVQELMVDRWPTWGSKEREKVLLFVSLLCLANVVVYDLLPETQSVCVSVAEAALLDAKPDVKFAAKRLLTALFLAEEQTKLLPRYRGASPGAGVAGKKADEGASTKPEQGLLASSGALTPLQTVQCLVILLYVSMDFGSPKQFTGGVIEALAPFGNGRKFQQTILTEVQNAFQAFLKNQQRSDMTWRECRKKLSAKQLDLVDAYKGKLSYFS